MWLWSTIPRKLTTIPSHFPIHRANCGLDCRHISSGWSGLGVKDLGCVFDPHSALSTTFAGDFRGICLWNKLTVCLQIKMSAKNDWFGDQIVSGILRDQTLVATVLFNQKKQYNCELLLEFKIMIFYFNI